MNLDPHARRYYRLQIDVTPTAAAPTEWEASFDGGANWFRAVPVDGLPAWLVAGPLAEQGTAVAVLPYGSTAPRIRLVAGAEIEVETPPTIDVIAA